MRDIHTYLLHTLQGATIELTPPFLHRGGVNSIVTPCRWNTGDVFQAFKIVV